YRSRRYFIVFTRTLVVAECRPCSLIERYSCLMPQLPASILDLTRWRSASNEAFGKLDIEAENPAEFQVELKTATAGDVSLFDMRTKPHTVTRRAEDIPDGDIPYCKLSLQMHGSSTMRQDGRECTLEPGDLDRKSTRLNSSHVSISYAVFCLKKKKKRLLERMTTREDR